MAVEINTAEITDAELELCYSEQLKNSMFGRRLPVELFIGRMLEDKGIRMNGYRPYGDFVQSRSYETQVTHCRQIIEVKKIRRL